MQEDKIPSDLHDWLLSIANMLLDDAVGHVRIDVIKTIERSEALIYFCRVSTGERSRMLCLKRFMDTNSTDVAALFERSSRLQPILESSNVRSPKFVACNPDLTTILMTFERGDSLEDLMIGSFFRSAKSASRCTTLVGNLAKSQSALNKSIVPAAGVKLASPCSNREYADRIREYLQDPFVRQCLSSPCSSPERVIDALGDAFWQRHERRLLHGDFQAKNVLADDDQDVILIDLDFGMGHPLFDVAQFLVQLIRLSRRWPFPRAERLLKHYGDHFLETFTACEFQYLKSDLPFFMIWATTFSLLADAHYQAPIRWYIRQHLQNSELAHAWGLFGRSIE